MVDTSYNLTADGSNDFSGGQDSSKVPDKVPDGYYYAGINTSVKEGVIRPRWGFERVRLDFPLGFILDPYQREISYRQLFESGKFQLAAPYYISGTIQCIVIVIGGIIFLYNPSIDNLSVIPIEDGSHLNSRAARLRWTAAGKYFVIYDFPAYPVIINGIEAKRADPAKLEIPSSTLGAFNQNRLFVANDGNEFTGGDPVGSTAAPDAPITFKEVLTPASPFYGQVFQLPTSDHNDPITFMGFLQQADTGTGNGPLIVGTNRAVYSYNTQNPRDTWEQGQFGTLICYNAGIVGARAFANVNSDAFFLSSDGFVRSLTMARDEQHRWARVPVSREVEKWFKYWDTSLISLGVVSYFRNKVLFTVNPYRLGVQDATTGQPISDYAHGGLVVMELDNTTSFGTPSKPSWAGLWTGVHPMDMVNLGERCFVVSKDETSVNRLYEINPDITYDTADDVIRQVRSRVYTKQYSCGDIFANKEIHTISINISNMLGDFKLDLKYQPSHSPYMIPWRTFCQRVPWRMCRGIPDSCLLNGYAPQTINEFVIGAPDDVLCNPLTEDIYKVFKKVQLQFTLEGISWQLEEFRIYAMPRPTSTLNSICDEYPPVSVCQQCNDDWYVAPFKSCETLQT